MDSRNVGLIPPMLFGKFESGMTKLIRRVVKKGWIICEIGAYVGDHTPLFSYLTGSDGKVISIEPQTFHFNLLLKNISLNRLTNVIPIKTAVSKTDGTSTMYIPLNQSVDGRLYKVKNEIRKKQKTITKTIDHLLKQYKSIDLIKMDIQGWEDNAIEGAKKTILRSPRLLLITEFWPKGLREAGTDPLKFLKSIKRLGLNIYSIDEFDGSLKNETNFQKLVDNSDEGDGKYIDLICSRNKIGPNFKD